MAGPLTVVVFYSPVFYDCVEFRTIDKQLVELRLLYHWVKFTPTMGLGLAQMSVP